jgi:hypothetical protein
VDQGGEAGAALDAAVLPRLPRQRGPPPAIRARLHPSRDPSPDGLEDAPDELELDLLREELTETRVAQARAEAAAEAKDALIAELKAMLAEARRPWWRRWVG